MVAVRARIIQADDDGTDARLACGQCIVDRAGVVVGVTMVVVMVMSIRHSLLEVHGGAGGDAADGVLGVEHRIGDELAHVVVLEAVEHLGAFRRVRTNRAIAQLGQVLRHRWRRLADPLGEVRSPRARPDQAPQQLHRVASASIRNTSTTRSAWSSDSQGCRLVICIHTQIMAEGCGAAS